VRVEPVRDDGNRTLDVPKLAHLARLRAKLTLFAVTDSGPVCARDAQEDRAGSMLRPGFRAASPGEAMTASLCLRSALAHPPQAASARAQGRRGLAPGKELGPARQRDEERHGARARVCRAGRARLSPARQGLAAQAQEKRVRVRHRGAHLEVIFLSKRQAMRQASGPRTCALARRHPHQA
jgi:hypothetical protein